MRNCIFCLATVIQILYDRNRIGKCRVSKTGNKKIERKTSKADTFKVFLISE